LKKGDIPEWPNGTDCKSVVFNFGGSNPPVPTALDFRKKREDLRRNFLDLKSENLGSISGSSSIGRAPAFQAGGCGFETRLPLKS
jgi:hypothetical protein